MLYFSSSNLYSREVDPGLYCLFQLSRRKLISAAKQWRNQCLVLVSPSCISIYPSYLCHFSIYVCPISQTLSVGFFEVHMRMHALYLYLSISVSVTSSSFCVRIPIYICPYVPTDIHPCHSYLLSSCL